MDYPTDRIVHTTAFIIPVMEHWLGNSHRGLTVIFKILIIHNLLSSICNYSRYFLDVVDIQLHNKLPVLGQSFAKRSPNHPNTLIFRFLYNLSKVNSCCSNL